MPTQSACNRGQVNSGHTLLNANDTLVMVQNGSRSKPGGVSWAFCKAGKG